MKKFFILFLTTFSICIGQQNKIETQFYLTTINNDNFFASEVYGPKSKNPKTTVFSFFATWCAPCQVEIKSLDSISSQFPDIKFYLINYREKKDTIINWLKNISKTSIPILLDTYGLIAETKFNIIQTDSSGNKSVKLPSLFIVNKMGEVVYSHNGFDDKGAINLINELRTISK